MKYYLSRLTFRSEIRQRFVDVNHCQTFFPRGVEKVKGGESNLITCLSKELFCSCRHIDWMS